jgi:hypothetical protein
VPFIFSALKDKMRNIKLAYLFSFIAITNLASADGVKIDKVYHPYIQPLKKEFEWRMTQADGKQQQRVGFKKSLSDRLYIEGYLIGQNQENHSMNISEYEIEAKYQLTEQGEYDIDWGILAEIERIKDLNGWEFNTALLMEKEWGRWVGATNLWMIYEKASTKTELESALAVQLRYRHSRYFEPALEFYSGQNTLGLGPVVMGNLRLGMGKKLHWETGVIFGLESKTPSQTFRFLTEFEF